ATALAATCASHRSAARRRAASPGILCPRDAASMTVLHVSVASRVGCAAHRVGRANTRLSLHCESQTAPTRLHTPPFTCGACEILLAGNLSPAGRSGCV